MRCEIIKVVSRWPNGLSCVPACQIETFSARHVSSGPTLIAFVGTSAMFPTGAARVLRDRERMQIHNPRQQLPVLRGTRRLVLVFPIAPQRIIERPMFPSPCPPCITAQRTLSQLFR